jgi:dephospho-CoA kinase
MGDIVREETAQRGFEINVETLGSVASQLREEFGPQIIAERCVAKINALPNSLVFIDGLRSMVEYEFFKKSFSMIVIAIDTPTEIRHEWLLKRGRADDTEQLEKIKARDEREIGFGVQEVIDAADFTIENSSSIDKLEQACELLITKVITMDKKSKKGKFS